MRRSCMSLLDVLARWVCRREDGQIVKPMRAHETEFPQKERTKREEKSAFLSGCSVNTGKQKLSNSDSPQNLPAIYVPVGDNIRIIFPSVTKCHSFFSCKE